MVVVIAIAIVVMIVPVALAVPAVIIFIPPAVVSAPTLLADFTELVACPVRLRAVPAMMLGRFVEPMIGAGNAALAIMIIGKGARSSRKQQDSAQGSGGQDRTSEALDISHQKRFHEFSLLLPLKRERGVRKYRTRGRGKSIGYFVYFAFRVRGVFTSLAEKCFQREVTGGAE